jgi:spermidine synthase
MRPVRFAASAVAMGFMVYGGYLYSAPTISTQKLGEHNLARKDFNLPEGRQRLLDYKEGNFSTLSVMEDEDSGARTLFVDGFSTATVTQAFGGSAYMEAMGFVPMALHPDPRRALVICFGTGNTLGTVSLFPGVEVDGVEIDRNVLSLAHWFSRWNHQALTRPNIHINIQDGRTFTRWTKNKYDVITLEPMSPVQAGVVHLYSQEFYQEASDRLEEDGIMMQWLPLHLVGPAEAQAIIKTFQEVYPHTSIWNSFLTRIVLLVGSKYPVRLDKNRFENLMQTPDIQSSAERMGIRSFSDLADFFITDGKNLEPFLEQAPIITDDRPLLEHSSVNLLPPLKWQTDESFLNLLSHRVGQWPPVTGIVDREKFRQEYATRTAQRLSVFSRRYHGPGESHFAQKNYTAGMEQLKIFLQSRQGIPISLKDARWGE